MKHILIWFNVKFGCWLFLGKIYYIFKGFIFIFCDYMSICTTRGMPDVQWGQRWHWISWNYSYRDLYITWWMWLLETWPWSSKEQQVLWNTEPPLQPKSFKKYLQGRMSHAGLRKPLKNVPSPKLCTFQWCSKVRIDCLALLGILHFHYTFDFYPVILYTNTSPKERKRKKTVRFEKKNAYLSSFSWVN